TCVASATVRQPEPHRLQPITQIATCTRIRLPPAFQRTWNRSRPTAAWRSRDFGLSHTKRGKAHNQRENGCQGVVQNVSFSKQVEIAPVNSWKQYGIPASGARGF